MNRKVSRGCVVKVLARGMTEYRPTAEGREPLATGRMLVITACLPEVRRTTRETALARNALVIALAAEMVVPHVAPGSPLARLLEKSALVGRHPQRLTPTAATAPRSCHSPAPRSGRPTP